MKHRTICVCLCLCVWIMFVHMHVCVYVWRMLLTINIWDMTLKAQVSMCWRSQKPKGVNAAGETKAFSTPVLSSFHLNIPNKRTCWRHLQISSTPVFIPSSPQTYSLQIKVSYRWWKEERRLIFFFHVCCLIFQGLLESRTISHLPSGMGISVNWWWWILRRDLIQKAKGFKHNRLLSLTKSLR